MKQKPVYIKANIGDSVEIGYIPVIDGERGRPSITWDEDKDGNTIECFGSTQYALEQEIDNHLREFMLAIMPFAEWLKEEGYTDYIEGAINAALTRRNSGKTTRIQGAQIMSDLVPHYRALSKAANDRGFDLKVHSYSPYTVILSNEEGDECCIEIKIDGSTCVFDAGCTDGYHTSCQGNYTTDINEVIERAINIATDTAD